MNGGSNMATYPELAEKLCESCVGLKEYGGQQCTVYASVYVGNFNTALNTLKTHGGCSSCIRLIENAR
jgi:hypothetical protein